MMHTSLGLRGSDAGQVAVATPRKTDRTAEAFRTDAGRAAASGTDAYGPAIERVFARYDMTAISPREVDRMARELQAAGFQDTRFMLTFQTRGEEFMQHLQRSLAEAGHPQVAFDPTARIDLIGQMEHQIKLARSHGDPTDHAEDFLRRLQDIQSRHPDRRPAGPSSGHLAEAVVMARSVPGPAAVG